jgi:hypothetical protein
MKLDIMEASLEENMKLILEVISFRRKYEIDIIGRKCSGKHETRLI